MVLSQTEAKRLKIAGSVAMTALSVIATLHARKGHLITAVVLYVLAVTIFSMSMLFPARFKRTTHIIADLIFAKFLLSVFFFLVITPFGIVMRIFGKDPLDKRIEKEKKSYWIKTDMQTGDYEKQF